MKQQRVSWRCDLKIDLKAYLTLVSIIKRGRLFQLDLDNDGVAKLSARSGPPHSCRKNVDFFASPASINRAQAMDPF